MTRTDETPATVRVWLVADEECIRTIDQFRGSEKAPPLITLLFILSLFLFRTLQRILYETEFNAALSRGTVVSRSLKMLLLGACTCYYRIIVLFIYFLLLISH